jgi:hypothetical protein
MPYTKYWIIQTNWRFYVQKVNHKMSYNDAPSQTWCALDYYNTVISY